VNMMQQLLGVMRSDYNILWTSSIEVVVPLAPCLDFAGLMFSNSQDGSKQAGLPTYAGHPPPPPPPNFALLVAHLLICIPIFSFFIAGDRDREASRHNFDAPGLRNGHGPPRSSQAEASVPRAAALISWHVRWA
jgi:hypothetical protein